MKIFCNFVIDDEDFVPKAFDLEAVDSIIDKLKDMLVKNFGKKYKQLQINFENKLFDDFHMEVDVIIRNNGEIKKAAKFEFEPYSDYFDESDYKQHLDRTLIRFVTNLLNR